MNSLSEDQMPIETQLSITDKLLACRKQNIHDLSESNENFIVERDQSMGRNMSDIYNQT